jgi:hypothetical protein
VTGIVSLPSWPGERAPERRVFRPSAHERQGAGGRDRPHRHQDKKGGRDSFGRTQRPFLVIPGPDPGIPADSAGWGDPRIKSGDDEDGKSCLHLDPYLDAYGNTPRSRARSPGHDGETKAYISSHRENALQHDRAERNVRRPKDALFALRRMRCSHEVRQSRDQTTG